MNEDPPDPLGIKPELPEKLAMYMRHALIKDPAQRFNSASEMIKYLMRIYPDHKASEKTEEKTQVELPVSASEDNRKTDSEIKSLNFFEGFEEDDLLLVSNECLRLEFNENDQVIQQNERDEGFYILVEGDLSIESINAGESFGEEAYLSGEPHPLSVNALSHVAVLHINNNLVEQLSASGQLKVYMQLAETLARKLASVNFESSISEFS